MRSDFESDVVKQNQIFAACLNKALEFFFLHK